MRAKEALNMDTGDMTIYFLHHSAVAAVFGETLLIFDYYRHDNGKAIAQGHVSENEIRAAKRVYAFVSHVHHDHYNPRIFDWAELNDNVTYLLDDTVPEPNQRVNAVMMRRGETFEDETIRVTEFGSTDIGGSFLVQCEGTSLFHAGDLNFWHWRDEGDEKYSRQMALYFDREMKFLKKRAGDIDVAFFPVDKRMGTGYDEGADMFLGMMHPKLFVPIHFVDFVDTRMFADKYKGGMTHVAAIKKFGQKII